MPAHVGERDQHPGRLLVPGTGRGDRARAGQRVEQPGRDGPLGPLVADRDVGRVADECAQHDRQRGQPGQRTPPRARDRSGPARRCCRRADDGGYGQDAAGGRAAGVRRAADHPADQVPVRKAAGQPRGRRRRRDRPACAAATRWTAAVLMPVANSTSAAPATIADDQRDAPGQPVAGLADRTRCARRRRQPQHDIDRAPGNGRQQGVRDGAGDRGGQQQHDPVTRPASAMRSSQPVRPAWSFVRSAVMRMSPAGLRETSGARPEEAALRAMLRESVTDGATGRA